MKRYAILGAVVLAVLGAVSAYAVSGGAAAPGGISAPITTTTPVSAAKPAAAAASAPGAVKKSSDKSSDKPFDKPVWSELTPLQQRALEPLSQRWDPLDSAHKHMWLQLSEKFAAMKPDEQARFHERMREWVKLTPEQRRQVRQNFWRAKTIAAEQKSAQWEQYQQLPDDQKKKLAADNAAKKQVATLPSALNDKGKAPPKASIVKPAKSASGPHGVSLKPTLAASVPALNLPQATVPAAAGVAPLPGAPAPSVSSAPVVTPAPPAAVPPAAPAAVK